MIDRPLTGTGAAYEHSKLLVDSYRRWTGRDLVPAEKSDGISLEEQLFTAPRVILSHGPEVLHCECNGVESSG